VILFPAIDILGGKAVRLYQGDYGQATVYNEDPGNVAAEFASAGAEWIHVVDLDAAKAGKPVNLEVIRGLCLAASIPVQVGGGIRTMVDAEAILNAGASRVILGSVLAKSPQLAADMLANLGERAVAGIDARDGRVAVEGWVESSDLEATALVKLMSERGATRFIVTDIATDGSMTGPNMKFLSEVLAATSAKVIASGGTGTLDHLKMLKDQLPSLEGVIVGKAIYEGTVSVSDGISVLR
jgi:phosphoribosylformimino-5-aminoimidazole carboxamide ribotide isomerase